MTTKFDQDDWESQLKTMMGENDAEDMRRRFIKIIKEHAENQGQPLDQLEIAVGTDDVTAWMHTVYDMLQVDDLHDGLKDILWNVGLELVRVYLESDELDPDEKCTDLVHYLWTVDDEDDEDDDDTVE